LLGRIERAAKAGVELGHGWIVENARARDVVDRDFHADRVLVGERLVQLQSPDEVAVLFRRCRCLGRGKRGGIGPRVIRLDRLLQLDDQLERALRRTDAGIGRLGVFAFVLLLRHGRLGHARRGRRRGRAILREGRRGAGDKEERKQGGSRFHGSVSERLGARKRFGRRHNPGRTDRQGRSPWAA
jgi:hypothetical protein